MKTFCPETILIGHILHTDRSPVWTRVRIGALNDLRFQILITEILHKSLRLCVLSIAGRVTVSEAAIVREFVVETGDRDLKCSTELILKRMVEEELLLNRGL